MIAQQWSNVGSVDLSAGQEDYTLIKIILNEIPVVAYKDYRNSYKATLTKYSVNESDSLQVELSSFSASVIESEVELHWETATEVNNYGFEIQRSVIPIYSKHPITEVEKNNWVKVGFVKGHGNSNSPKKYFFVDKDPEGGSTYEYRLKQIDNDGKFKYSDAVTVKIGVPNKTELMQNSPNPFNPTTSIKFYIPNASKVEIQIYDLLGRKIKTLLNGQTAAGYHIIYWNGEDEFGGNVASGIYLYRLTARSFMQTKKMVLLK